jgi:hypothetical protein
MGVTIYADRSKIPGPVKLRDVGLLRLLDPTVDFEMPIMSKIDGQAAQILQMVKYVAPTTTTPVPPVETNVLYDSNIDIDWTGIAADLADDPPERQRDHLIISDLYGNFVPNGRYFRMKASGNPRMLLFPATHELCLEHDGKYGRGYFGACNFDSVLSGKFKLTDPRHKFSVKTLNRHQFRDVFPKATNEERQGGQGTGIGIDSVDSDLEVYHDGGEVSGPQRKLSPKLDIDVYYPFKHTVWHENKLVNVKFELDRGNGFEIVNEGTTKAPKQFWNKDQFTEWSEFWLRLNTPLEKNQRLWLKDILLESI